MVYDETHNYYSVEKLQFKNTGQMREMLHKMTQRQFEVGPGVGDPQMKERFAIGRGDRSLWARMKSIESNSGMGGASKQLKFIPDSLPKVYNPGSRTVLHEVNDATRKIRRLVLLCLGLINMILWDFDKTHKLGILEGASSMTKFRFISMIDLLRHAKTLARGLPPNKTDSDNAKTKYIADFTVTCLVCLYAAFDYIEEHARRYKDKEPIFEELINYTGRSVRSYGTTSLSKKMSWEGNGPQFMQDARAELMTYLKNQKNGDGTPRFPVDGNGSVKFNASTEFTPGEQKLGYKKGTHLKLNIMQLCIKWAYEGNLVDKNILAGEQVGVGKTLMGILVARSQWRHKSVCDKTGHVNKPIIVSAPNDFLVRMWKTELKNFQPMILVGESNKELGLPEGVAGNQKQLFLDPAMINAVLFVDYRYRSEIKANPSNDECIRVSDKPLAINEKRVLRAMSTPGCVRIVEEAHNLYQLKPELRRDRARQPFADSVINAYMWKMRLRARTLVELDATQHFNNRNFDDKYSQNGQIPFSEGRFAQILGPAFSSKDPTTALKPITIFLTGTYYDLLQMEGTPLERQLSVQGVDQFNDARPQAAKVGVDYGNYYGVAFIVNLFSNYDAFIKMEPAIGTMPPKLVAQAGAARSVRFQRPGLPAWTGGPKTASSEDGAADEKQEGGVKDYLAGYFARPIPFEVGFARAMEGKLDADVNVRRPSEVPNHVANVLNKHGYADDDSDPVKALRALNLHSKENTVDPEVDCKLFKNELDLPGAVRDRAERTNIMLHLLHNCDSVLTQEEKREYESQAVYRSGFKTKHGPTIEGLLKTLRERQKKKADKNKTAKAKALEAVSTSNIFEEWFQETASKALKPDASQFIPWKAGQKTKKAPLGSLTNEEQRQTALENPELWVPRLLSIADAVVSTYADTRIVIPEVECQLVDVSYGTRIDHQIMVTMEYTVTETVPLFASASEVKQAKITVDENSLDVTYRVPYGRNLVEEGAMLLLERIEKPSKEEVRLAKQALQSTTLSEDAIISFSTTDPLLKAADGRVYFRQRMVSSVRTRRASYYRRVATRNGPSSARLLECNKKFSISAGDEAENRVLKCPNPEARSSYLWFTNMGENGRNAAGNETLDIKYASWKPRQLVLLDQDYGLRFLKDLIVQRAKDLGGEQGEAAAKEIDKEIVVLEFPKINTASNSLIGKFILNQQGEGYTITLQEVDYGDDKITESVDIDKEQFQKILQEADIDPIGLVLQESDDGLKVDRVKNKYSDSGNNSVSMGSVITHVDSKQVFDISSFYAAIDNAQRGGRNKVDLSFNSKGASKKATAELGVESCYGKPLTLTREVLIQVFKSRFNSPKADASIALVDSENFSEGLDVVGRNKTGVDLLILGRVPTSVKDLIQQLGRVSRFEQVDPKNKECSVYISCVEDAPGQSFKVGKADEGRYRDLREELYKLVGDSNTGVKGILQNFYKWSLDQRIVADLNKAVIELATCKLDEQAKEGASKDFLSESHVQNSGSFSDDSFKQILTWIIGGSQASSKKSLLELCDGTQRANKLSERNCRERSTENKCLADGGWLSCEWEPAHSDPGKVRKNIDVAGEVLGIGLGGVVGAVAGGATGYAAGSFSGGVGAAAGAFGLGLEGARADGVRGAVVGGVAGGAAGYIGGRTGAAAGATGLALSGAKAGAALGGNTGRYLTSTLLTDADSGKCSVRKSLNSICDDLGPRIAEFATWFRELHVDTMKTLMQKLTSDESALYWQLRHYFSVVNAGGPSAHIKFELDIFPLPSDDAPRSKRHLHGSNVVSKLLRVVNDSLQDLSNVYMELVCTALVMAHVMEEMSFAANRRTLMRSLPAFCGQMRIALCNKDGVERGIASLKRVIDRRYTDSGAEAITLEGVYVSDSRELWWMTTWEDLVLPILSLQFYALLLSK